MNPNILRAPVLAALSFLEKHSGGKYRRLSAEEDRTTVSINFDSQREAEAWAYLNVGECYRETDIYSQSQGYLAHDYPIFTLYLHFPKTFPETLVIEHSKGLQV